VAAEGVFGLLADSVFVSLGEPFNEFFEELAVVSGVMTPIFEYEVPGPATLYVQGISLSSRINCTVEVLKNSVIAWEGGTDVLHSDLPPTSFSGGALVGVPGDVFEVRVRHVHASPLRFAGNIFGYTR
jgi:hypothetical protein